MILASGLFCLNKLNAKKRLLGERTMKVCSTFGTREGSVYVLRIVTDMKRIQYRCFRREGWICKRACVAIGSIERRGFEKRCKMVNIEVESGLQ